MIDPEIKKYINEAMLSQTRELQKLMDQQQMDRVAMERSFIARWNSVNAIVRVLYKKGLITNETLEEAGEELMKEAKANFELAKQAAKDKTHLVGIKPSPLDEVEGSVKKVFARENARVIVGGKE